jgi:hypothetical protein
LSRIYFTDRDLGKQFPEILRAGGLDVRRHADLFPPTCPDEAWLEAIGKRQWVALTHDRRIRYKPNEQAAVIRHGVALLVIIGKATLPDLAKSFLMTILAVEAFLDGYSPPFIAKVYRAEGAKLERNPDSPGRIEYWFP